MKNISFFSGHNFSKTNIVTIIKGGRNYDEYKCSACGIKGKRYGLSEYVAVAETYSDNLIRNCIVPEHDAYVGKRIKVRNISITNPAFNNCLPNSIHIIITPPEEFANGGNGVWIQGVGEPVKLLFNEFTLLKRTKFSK